MVLVDDGVVVLVVLVGCDCHQPPAPSLLLFEMTSLFFLAPATNERDLVASQAGPKENNNNQRTEFRDLASNQSAHAGNLRGQGNQAVLNCCLLMFPSLWLSVLSATGYGTDRTVHHSEHIPPNELAELAPL